MGQTPHRKVTRADTPRARKEAVTLDAMPAQRFTVEQAANKLATEAPGTPAVDKPSRPNTLRSAPDPMGPEPVTRPRFPRLPRGEPAEAVPAAAEETRAEGKRRSEKPHAKSETRVRCRSAVVEEVTADLTNDPRTDEDRLRHG